MKGARGWIGQDGVEPSMSVSVELLESESSSSDMPKSNALPRGARVIHPVGGSEASLPQASTRQLGLQIGWAALHLPAPLSLPWYGSSSR